MKYFLHKTNKNIWEKEKRFKYKNLIIFILVFSISFSISINLNYNKIKNYSMSQSNDFDVYCDNSTMLSTSICLNKFVRRNFKYTKTDDSIDLTFLELLEKGGDCNDWTKFYKKNLNYYGYKTKETEFFIEDVITEENKYSAFHIFLIVYDDTGYCLLDQTRIFCYMFELEQETQENYEIYKKLAMATGSR